MTHHIRGPPHTPPAPARCARFSPNFPHPWSSPTCQTPLSPTSACFSPSPDARGLCSFAITPPSVVSSPDDSSLDCPSSASPAALQAPAHTCPRVPGNLRTHNTDSPLAAPPSPLHHHPLVARAGSRGTFFTLPLISRPPCSPTGPLSHLQSHL